MKLNKLGYPHHNNAYSVRAGCPELREQVSRLLGTSFWKETNGTEKGCGEEEHDLHQGRETLNSVPTHEAPKLGPPS